LKCILLHNTFISATVFSFYIFTFLMFRKLNKPQLTKKKQICIGIHAFDSRLIDISRSFKWIESFIFRYFKVFQLSQMFTCGLSDLLLVLAVGSLVVFVLREYILKVHILVSSEHKLCQTWNTCLLSCIYWSAHHTQSHNTARLKTGVYKLVERAKVGHGSLWSGGCIEKQIRCWKNCWYS
jgi:hypothetical protein